MSGDTSAFPGKHRTIYANVLQKKVSQMKSGFFFKFVKLSVEAHLLCLLHTDRSGVILHERKR